MQLVTEAMDGMDNSHPAIDTLSRFRVFCNRHRMLDGKFIDQFGLRFPSRAVAVLCQGDFIRRVGRAYRMSAMNRPRHAFPRLSGTSAGVIRQQGLHSSCGECQNTAPHGARFLTEVGRTHGLKVSKVSSSLARRPEKQRPRKTPGYR
jgi:hypothetical protein